MAMLWVWQHACQGKGATRHCSTWYAPFMACKVFLYFVNWDLYG